MTELVAQQRDERGFTLIELLIAIVVVGVLTAVAIVGIGGLVDNGSGAACRATRDAAKTASAVHFANTDSYPNNFGELVSPRKELDIPSNVTPNPPGPSKTLSNGSKWTLTMSGGGNTPNDFTGCP
jgi:prepilin-type N-terminal cleavage/methylation domain-containing protein